LTTRRAIHLVFALATFVVLGATSPAARATGSQIRMTEEEARARASFRYVHMSNEEAFAELDRRGAPYKKLERVAGVRAPVRLTGPLHGVDIHSSLDPELRAESPFEVLDARLALALDDFAVLLERHDIVELVHFTMYRPNVAKPGSELELAHDEPEDAAQKPAQKQSSKAAKSKGKGKGKKLGKDTSKRSGKKARSTKQKKGPAAKKEAAKKEAAKKDAGAKKVAAKKAAKKGAVKDAAKRAKKDDDEDDEPVAPVKKARWAPPGTRHPAGLAIDVGALRKRDGTWLRVAQHFKGHIGAATCGAPSNATSDDSAPMTEGAELRAIACSSVAEGIFTYVLTPNHDAAHFDHFHMEIRPDTLWAFVR
jgi:hypothetical protein